MTNDVPEIIAKKRAPQNGDDPRNVLCPAWKRTRFEWCIRLLIKGFEGNVISSLMWRLSLNIVSRILCKQGVEDRGGSIWNLLVEILTNDTIEYSPQDHRLFHRRLVWRFHTSMNT